MDGGGGAGDIVIPSLNPGSTYNFRLAKGDEKGPELVVDTQGASITAIESLLSTTPRPPSQLPIALPNPNDASSSECVVVSRKASAPSRANSRDHPGRLRSYI